jgi:cell wall-associated NlpC family hydrolase
VPILSARRLIVASALVVAAAGLAMPTSLAAPALAAPALAAPALAAPALAARALGAPRDRSTAELDRRIEEASHRLEVIVEQYNESGDDLRANLARQRSLAAQVGPMAQDLQRRQGLIGELAGQTYRRTVHGPGVAMVGSSDPQEFIGKLMVLHELATEQQRAVTELTTARQRVGDTRTMLTLLAAQQRRTQQQLAAKKSVVEDEISALKQMRRAAYGGGSRYAQVVDVPEPSDLEGPAGRVVAFAFAQLGKPYSWGAAGPRAYDCSGLTLAAWERAGLHLPHNAARQYGATTRVDRADARPGDLVFFYGRISHVGVYIGGGMMIHAPEYGENVRIAPIDSQPIHGFGRPSPGDG